jgi:hypothetical protein
MGQMQMQSDPRNGVPNWEISPQFKKDVFTFVRVQYTSDWGGGYRQYGGGGGWGRGWSGGWDTDFPDSDLNLSYRLQQLTSLKVSPEPIYRSLTAEDLPDYPFLYMIEPGSLVFSDEEVKALRHYLFNGGFMMVDDFWGDRQWRNFETEIKRVFPDREIQELDLSHPIFQCVYPLKEKPQVPSIHSWLQTGLTYEPYHGGDCSTVHYKAIFDDKDRMMMIICHNTDLGDGWEREGEDPEYFELFAKKKSYPMGINIITYAMTH